MNDKVENIRRLRLHIRDLLKLRAAVEDGLYKLDGKSDEFLRRKMESRTFSAKIEECHKELDKLDPYVKLPKIPMEELKKGRVYKIQCRNLSYGAWDGEKGFVGIRNKFGSYYLFREYHWDTGAPHGTVDGQEDTGIDVPDDIVINESGRYDTVDENGRALVKDETVANPRGYAWKGWYRYVDTGELLPKEGHYYAAHNTELFKFLKKIEEDNGHIFPERSD